MTLPVAILCGGLGTRLYPLTKDRPKALVEVSGQPFLAHQLQLLKSAGIRRVVLCVGRYGETLRDYAGDGSRFGLTLEYSFDGPMLLGTGGAVRRALSLLGDEFFVLYGDSYLPCDYLEVERSFKTAGKQALMTVCRNEGQWDKSNVKLSSRGEILIYDKKNTTSGMCHIDYGLGIFRASAFNRITPDTAFDLADLYQQLLTEGQLSGYVVKERFYEVGSFKGIEDLEAFLARRRNR